MLMRTDPFRELDRVAEQVFGTAARPAAMPIDAYRKGDEFVVLFDLPGCDADSINLTVERNVVADYTDGVLRLRIPVREQAKPRRVDISVGRNESKPIEANSSDDSREPAGATAS